MVKFRRAAAAIAAGVLGCVVAAWQTAGSPAGFRFAIIGDRTGGAVPGVYESVWREVSKARPEFAINVGDTIEGGKDARIDAEWREARAIYGRCGCTLHFTPGNHDIWSEASRKAWEKDTGGRPFYGFDYGGAHFTVLDNSRTQELSPDQLKFLESDLAAHAGRSPKFVFLHKPFWMVYLALGSGGFPLHRIARKYGVTHVFSGHLHQFFRMERDGVVYTAVGSSGAALGHGAYRGTEFKDGWFYQYLLARVGGGTAKVTVHELPPPHGQGRSFGLEEWGK